MTITAMMHRVTKMSASHAPVTSTAWLTITGEKQGETFAVFMPLKQAEMVAAAFAEYEDWESGQEGPTFDDALGARCDATARQEAARALK